MGWQLLTSICAADGAALSNCSHYDAYALIMSLPERCREQIGWNNPTSFLLRHENFVLDLKSVVSVRLRKLAKMLDRGVNDAG